MQVTGAKGTMGIDRKKVIAWFRKMAVTFEAMTDEEFQACTATFPPELSEFAAMINDALETTGLKTGDAA